MTTIDVRTQIDWWRNCIDIEWSGQVCGFNVAVHGCDDERPHSD